MSQSQSQGGSGTRTDELRDIFMDLSEDGTVTEHQEESHSHDPVEAGDELVESLTRATEDGLDDAVDLDFDGGAAGSSA